MISRFTSALAAPRRFLARLALSVSLFFASSLDRILAELAILEGALDSYVERQSARILRNDRAAEESFRREGAAIVEERNLRVDLDNDTLDATTEINRAAEVRRKVRKIVGE